MVSLLSSRSFFFFIGLFHTVFTLFLPPLSFLFDPFIDWMEYIYHVEVGSCTLGLFTCTCVGGCAWANIHVYDK